jgi:hypothetical protein
LPQFQQVNDFINWDNLMHKSKFARYTLVAIVCATALAVANAGVALAETPTITAVPNNWPNVKKEPRFPGMFAEINVSSGKAVITVLDASTVTVDGHEYSIGNDQKMAVSVEHHATVVTGTYIIVEFENATGTYRAARNFQRDVEFSGTGTIDQDKYDQVRFFGAGKFTATDWISVEANENTVVHTIDVRDVVAFNDSDVTVSRCWIATGFSTKPVKTTRCGFSQGNAAPQD